MSEAAFHAALRDDPRDELTWQALADFLDDTGLGGRAELLRLVRRRPSLTGDERAAASERITELLEEGVKPVLVERVNSIGMRLVLVCEGSFVMGAPAAEPGRRHDEDQHLVTLMRPFWLGVFPVTQGQYRAVIGTSPSHYRRGNPKVETVSDADLELFPVEYVTYHDAQAFVKKLTDLEKQAGGPPCYLPTEAEWEYACRGGHLICDPDDVHTRPFHLDRPTASLSSTQANFDGNHPHGPLGKPGPFLNRTCKVGSYEPNVLGIHDLHGNVYDWCADWYGGYPAGPLTDPTGPSRGTMRVLRGGGPRNFGEFCRAAFRYNQHPTVRRDDFGFRVVAVPFDKADRKPRRRPRAAQPRSST